MSGAVTESSQYPVSNARLSDKIYGSGGGTLDDADTEDPSLHIHALKIRIYHSLSQYPRARCGWQFQRIKSRMPWRA